MRRVKNRRNGGAFRIAINRVYNLGDGSHILVFADAFLKNLNEAANVGEWKILNRTYSST